MNKRCQNLSLNHAICAKILVNGVEFSIKKLEIRIFIYLFIYLCMDNGVPFFHVFVVDQSHIPSSNLFLLQTSILNTQDVTLKQNLSFRFKQINIFIYFQQFFKPNDVLYVTKLQRFRQRNSRSRNCLLESEVEKEIANCGFTVSYNEHYYSFFAVDFIM